MNWVKSTMLKHIGILTSGGRLSRAERGHSRRGQGGARAVSDGSRSASATAFAAWCTTARMPLESSVLSGILTSGGTILGTSRDKPHQMDIGGEIRDMTGAIVDTYQPQSPRRPDLHRRRRHAEERPAPEGGRPERGHPAENHRQRHCRGPTSPSVSIRPWGLPPRRSTGCIPRPPVTSGSSWSRSWAIGPAGWPWARASPAGPTCAHPGNPLRSGSRGRGHPRPGPRRQTFSIVAVAEGAMSIDDAAARPRDARRETGGQVQGR